MATRDAVAAMFKVLSRAFAGTVDAPRFELYYVALDDIDDGALECATVFLVKTWTGAFIPPPAVIRNAAMPAPAAVDVSAVIRQIEKLSIYNPNTGMIRPPVATVRDRLGEVVAYAYAASGGDRLFADDDVTRSIAVREFQTEITAAVRAGKGPGQLPVLTPVADGASGLHAATEQRRISR